MNDRVVALTGRNGPIFLAANTVRLLSLPDLREPGQIRETPEQYQAQVAMNTRGRQAAQARLDALLAELASLQGSDKDVYRKPADVGIDARSQDRQVMHPGEISGPVYAHDLEAS